MILALYSHTHKPNRSMNYILQVRYILNTKLYQLNIIDVLTC